MCLWEVLSDTLSRPEMQQKNQAPRTCEISPNLKVKVPTYMTFCNVEWWLFPLLAIPKWVVPGKREACQGNALTLVLSSLKIPECPYHWLDVGYLLELTEVERLKNVWHAKQSKPNLKEIYDLQSSQKLIFLFSQRLKSVFVVRSDIINVMAATSFMVHLRENKKNCWVKWPVDYMVWRERALLGFQSCLCKTQLLWPHAVALVIIITMYLLPAGRGPHPHLLLMGFLKCPKKRSFLRLSWEDEIL